MYIHVYTCVCMVESLHCSPETLLISYIPLQNKKFKRKKKRIFLGHPLCFILTPEEEKSRCVDVDICPCPSVHVAAALIPPSALCSETCMPLAAPSWAASTVPLRAATCYFSLTVVPVIGPMIPFPSSLPFSTSFLLAQDFELKTDSDQIRSITQSCLTLCVPMDCSTPGLPVHHKLPEFTQTHVHWVGDAIQPSHPLSSPSPPAFNLSQQSGFFQMS